MSKYFPETSGFGVGVNRNEGSLPLLLPVRVESDAVGLGKRDKCSAILAQLLNINPGAAS